MIRNIIFCFFLIYAEFCFADSIPNIQVENFSFYVDSGNLKLNGILCIPSSSQISEKKVVIMQTPPYPSDADYHGMYSELAEVFAHSGIASLRFENRAKNLNISGEEVTMYNQADDLHDAFLSLKRDRRFATYKIGLLGHSEGGSAVAIESSKNNDIAFAIILSSCGIKGTDFIYYQSTLRIDYLKLHSIQDKWIRKEIWDKIRIIERYNSPTIIQSKLKEHDAMLYNDSVFRIKAYGNMTLHQVYKQTLDKWANPHFIAVTKYDPKVYYSKISCPIILLYGKMDEWMDWKDNADGIEKIFIDIKKRNYEILRLDSINHSYCKCDVYTPFFISISHMKSKNIEYSTSIWRKIINWIATLQ